MGVIVATFHGMGADYVTSTASPKLSILNLMHEEMKAADLVDELMSRIDKTDLAFVPIRKDVIEELCHRNIDFDAFYPSKDRRIEIIESMVRSRTVPKEIADTDRNFDSMIDLVEANDNACCHKHRLDGKWQDVVNNPMLVEYLESVEKSNQTTNEPL